MNSNRRNFIKSAAGIGMAMSTGSHLFHIGTSPLRKGGRFDHIGHGDFKYRVHKEWGTQDSNQFPVKDCHEMVVDKKGRLILLTNHIRNNVLIYDRSGKVTDSWTGNWPGAHGLTIHEEGEEEFLYITDHDLHKVFKCTLGGKVILTLDYPRESGVYDEGPDNYKPTETAIGPNGDIYIADGYGKSYILQYDAKGNYIRHFGGKGESQKQFDCCHGIIVDNRTTTPQLLITSRSKQEFKQFSLDGIYKSTIQLPGCWICRPVIKGTHLYFAVIVTKSWDQYDGMLAILNMDNQVISFPGGSSPQYENGKLIPPEYDQTSFYNPHDVCIDSDENLYVPQWNSNKTYPVMLERV